MSLTPSLASIREFSDFLSYPSTHRARAGRRLSTYGVYSIDPRLSDVMGCSRVSKDTKVFGLLPRPFQTMTSAPPLWTEPRKACQRVFLQVTPIDSHLLTRPHLTFRHHQPSLLSLADKLLCRMKNEEYRSDSR